MARGKMTAETADRLEGYQPQKKYTSISIMPEEYELLKKVGKEIGVSHSKVVGLAVRRYAVEMGVAELDGDEADG